jgi:hypothetical protein
MYKLSIFRKKHGGYALLLVLSIVAIASIIGSGIFVLAQRRSRVSQLSKQTVQARYASEMGIECALYQIVRKEAYDGGSYDECNGVIPTVTGSDQTGYDWQFVVNDQDYGVCAEVHISANNPYFSILSFGYTECDESGPQPGRFEAAQYVVQADLSYGSGTGITSLEYTIDP